MIVFIYADNVNLDSFQADADLMYCLLFEDNPLYRYRFDRKITFWTILGHKMIGSHKSDWPFEGLVGSERCRDTSEPLGIRMTFG